MSTATSRSVDNSLSSLTNTNLGLELTRAVKTEQGIASSLAAYQVSNDLAVSNLSASLTSSLASSTALFNTQTATNTSVTSSIAGNYTKLLSEGTRAAAAESVLTASVATAVQDVVAENARAVLAEHVLTANNQTNTNNIADISTSIRSLTASRATDESSISASASAIAILQTGQTQMSSAQIADESVIATHTSEIAAIVASQVSEATRAKAAEVAVKAEADLASASITTLVAQQATQVIANAGYITRFNDAFQREVTLSSTLTNLNTQYLTKVAYDDDETVSGSWSNFGKGSACAASIRFTRLSNVVTVSFSPFTANPDSSTSGATYSLAVPDFAVPSAPVECCLVVSTGGLRSSGCVVFDASNSITLVPFNGTWGSSGGLNQMTTVSYII